MVTQNKKAFTLIELLLVMILLSILTIALLGNYFSSLKKGKDAKRKGELNQMQKALEIYYEDNGTYPTFTDIFGKKFCTTASCGASDRVYMIQTPQDPSTGYTYVYRPEPTAAPSSSSSYFYLFSYIENEQDIGNNVSQNGFTSSVPELSNMKCDTAATPTKMCRFYVGSYNAPPLTPIP